MTRFMRMSYVVAYAFVLGIALGRLSRTLNIDDDWILGVLVAMTVLVALLELGTMRAYAAGRRNGYQLASGTDPVLGDAHEFDATSAPTVRIVGGSRKQWKKRDRMTRLEVMR